MNGKQSFIENYKKDYKSFCSHVGLTSKLSFLILDDLSITLNERRFLANLLIGMALYTESDIEHYCLESMINHCGVAAGKLPKEIEISEISVILTNYIDNYGCDLSYKNHFINVYDAVDSWIVVLHTSFSFAKNGFQGIPGLYPQEDGYFFKNSILFNGEFGNYHFLIDNKAKEFREASQLLELQCKQGRSQILNSLFPNIDIYFNRSHVNIPKKGLVCLGCYYSDNQDPLILTEAPLEPLYSSIFSNYIPIINGYLEPHGTGINFEWTQYKRENNHHIFKSNEKFIILKKLSSIPRIYNTVNKTDFIQFQCVLSGNL
jgi:hypothetical protein